MSNSVTFQFETRVDLEDKMRDFLSGAPPGVLVTGVTEDAAPGEPTRDELKDILDGMGVEYNKRLGLDSLKALVAAQETAGPLAGSGAGSGGSSVSPPPNTESGVAPEPEADLFADDAPKEVTKEDLRSELETYINKIGAEGQAKAFAILKEVAGVARLADLPVEKYAAVVAKLKA